MIFSEYFTFVCVKVVIIDYKYIEITTNTYNTLVTDVSGRYYVYGTFYFTCCEGYILLVS